MSRKRQGDCLQTIAACGPCAHCGIALMDGVHFYRNRMYCSAHCPECGATESHEWGDKPASTTGKQLDLDTES